MARSAPSRSRNGLTFSEDNLRLRSMTTARSRTVLGGSPMPAITVGAQVENMPRLIAAAGQRHVLADAGAAPLAPSD